MEKYRYLACIIEDERIPTLKQVADTYGENTAIEWLNIQIEHFLNSSEQEKVVSSGAILEFARLLFINYPFLNLYEFCFFIAKCRVGEYGPLYGKSGPSQVAAMFQVFLGKRESAVEQIRRDKAQQERERQNLYTRMVFKSILTAYDKRQKLVMPRQSVGLNGTTKWMLGLRHNRIKSRQVNLQASEMLQW